MMYMEERQHLPDVNRLSVLVSTILLAYALTPFVRLPERELALRIFGAVFDFRVNFNTSVSIMVAALAAVGTEWLVRGHPSLKEQNTAQHWLLPALTAWVIGVPLQTLAVDLQWWAVFALGGVLLVLVFLAEYIVVDLSDDFYAPASVGLTAISFALYLFLAISVRAGGLRLYTMLPALVLTIGLVSLRSLYLRLGGRWCVIWAAGIAIVVGQFSIGFHYWPLSPLEFGLLVLGPAYALTSLAGSLEEGRPLPTIWIEPAIMLAAMWGLAGLVG